ncbi:MAG TPA: Uma2 family endonuclease [Oscillatoriales cyanobacterium M59_W2019_021]|nr:MAG: Uma2 family endonuclease [Cyanobacteria bacterium J055]HIK33834.1 Uma2 family endonuclease [Oscillatoriales cyanobacterium M4454_W2019_049]HIK50688.1 Uma2 family endonuclease [Oscillatoriales cyanobacterium M59_W2019_021]
MTVQLLTRKFSTFQYHKMIETGILTESDRVELIRGEIVEMAAVGRRHASQVRRLNTFFSNRFRGEAIVDVQNPIELSDRSEPEPDIALLKPRADFYESRHPQPSDVFLLVEVSDTTLAADREIKIPLYAEAQIPEVWIVNLNEQCVEVYRQPQDSEYRDVRIFRRGESLSILAFADRAIEVDDLLGK